MADTVSVTKTTSTYETKYEFLRKCMETHSEKDCEKMWEDHVIKMYEGKTDDEITLQWADLPDNDFAYVPPEAKGKNGLKSKRKMPIHDEAHVRNALARFNQTDIPAGEKRKALAKICARAKKFGIKSDFCKEHGLSEVDDATLTALDEEKCVECEETSLVEKIAGKIFALFKKEKTENDSDINKDKPDIKQMITMTEQDASKLVAELSAKVETLEKTMTAYKAESEKKLADSKAQIEGFQRREQERAEIAHKALAEQVAIALKRKQKKKKH